MSVGSGQICFLTATRGLGRRDLEQIILSLNNRLRATLAAAGPYLKLISPPIKEKSTEFSNVLLWLAFLFGDFKVTVIKFCVNIIYNITTQKKSEAITFSKLRLVLTRT